MPRKSTAVVLEAEKPNDQKSFNKKVATINFKMVVTEENFSKYNGIITTLIRTPGLINLNMICEDYGCDNM